jgi:hypothetical protein
LLARREYRGVWTGDSGNAHVAITGGQEDKTN